MASRPALPAAVRLDVSAPARRKRGAERSEFVARAKALRREGLSYEKVAKSLGVCKKTVMNWCAESDEDGWTPAPVEPSADRKSQPLYAGCLAYFPDALLAIAALSRVGNDKHNPGESVHWSKGKSPDHADCLARHLLRQGQIDPETGLSHTVAVAWRGLALLQTEIEAAKPRG